MVKSQRTIMNQKGVVLPLCLTDRFLKADGLMDLDFTVAS